MTERQKTSATQSVGHSALVKQAHVVVCGVGPMMALQCGWVWGYAMSKKKEILQIFDHQNLDQKWLQPVY